MATYIQANRPLSVSTPLGPDALLLVGLAGHEAISRLFSFQLDLLAENDTPIPFDRLLGQKATACLGPPDERPRHVSGICSRISQGTRDESFTAFRMEVVPEFWFLTRIAQSRIFQQKAVPEILKEVLTGLNVEFQLSGPYEPRDYCVQYRETDFNFASRLMEEEGIFYFFEHTRSGHRMVVADAPGSFPELPPVRFEEWEGGTRVADDRVFGWEKVQELRSGKVTLWDHCFELPHKHLEAERRIQDSVQAGAVTHKLMIGRGDKLELYDYPGAYAQRFDGVNPGGGDRPADLQKIFADNQRTAAIRMQEEAVPGLVIQGTGNIRHFTSGSRLTLERHFDADGPYLLTGVHHAAKLADDYRSGGGGGWSYSNRFTCTPAALPYRPARTTPKPVVQGSQTAVVVGPPGEEIFPDKYGRVKVQFHWDRQGQNDANSSCWIRVSTPWAGRNWGMIHIPRIGQEVVVSFLEGDPDRPLITGSVYNADMMPPYDLPAEKTKSTLKSRSSPGGGPANYNEIRFEDRMGSEQVFINAERDLDLRVEHDEREFVGHDRHLIVKAEQRERVEGDKHGLVVGDHREKIGGDLSLQVVGRRNAKIGTVDATEAGQEIHLKAGTKVIIEAGTQLTLVGSGGFIDIGPGGVTIEGTQVKVNCGGSPGAGSGSSPEGPIDPDAADDGSKTGKLN